MLLVNMFIINITITIITLLFFINNIKDVLTINPLVREKSYEFINN